MEKKNDIITFDQALDNLRQKDKQLNDVLFESIFYYNNMGVKLN